MVTGLRELFRNTESSKFVRTSKRKKREKNWTLNPKPYCPIVSKETLVIESDVWLMIIDLNLYHSKCLESAICKLQRQNFELWSCSWQNNQELKEQNQIVASSSWSHNWSLNHPLNFEQTRLIISKPGSLKNRHPPRGQLPKLITTSLVVVRLPCLAKCSLSIPSGHTIPTTDVQLQK
jgi:hypothetical protein